MAAGFAFKWSEFPDTKLPPEFSDLLLIGKKNGIVELYNRKWEIATLETWENREIARKLNNTDLLTRSQLQPVEVLTCAIQSLEDLKTHQKYDFSMDENKPTLRSLLLLFDPKVVLEFYSAYQILEEAAKREYREKYGDAVDRIRSDFFGLSGKSSTDLDSKIP